MLNGKGIGAGQNENFSVREKCYGCLADNIVWDAGPRGVEDGEIVSRRM
jgi:hypothetical protein